MKIKKLLFFSIVYIFSISSLNAQNSVNTSGNNLTGVNGTVSYSVGQVIYTTNTGTNGSNSQGVQQPFEISEVLSSIDYSSIVKDLKIYPNPSSNLLILNISNFNDIKLDFEILDINGKILITEKNLKHENIIDITSFSNAVYFLKINHENEAIKTFKIIKK
ncbi:T9SS type A sorting domain-containing protein [Flavobacterium sp.]|jgi:hypothetical protein|uniref:T9SS type A sorting domain-containing protein n=1 Tax=Flavobacterium sp. TaxID=239 RepID=UPI0040488F4C